MPNFIAPVYIAELAPPSLRGLFVTLTGVQLMVGQALASFMGLAFFSPKAVGSSQWRGPMGIQILFPVLTLAIVYWLPESPRWLLMQARIENAREVVMSLHGKDTAAQEFASAEFYQMSKQAEFDRTLDSSWKACFSRPSYRKRFEICCMYGWITQCTGLLVISAYGSVLYGNLGYGPREQILFQCGYLIVAVVFNILGEFIHASSPLINADSFYYRRSDCGYCRQENVDDHWSALLRRLDEPRNLDGRTIRIPST
jgi:MFS family permease